jgi:hypothetical protein
LPHSFKARKGAIVMVGPSLTNVRFLPSRDWATGRK